MVGGGRGGWGGDAKYFSATILQYISSMWREQVLASALYNISFLPRVLYAIYYEHYVAVLQ